MPQTYILAVRSGDRARSAPEAVSWTRIGSPVPGTAGMNGDGQDLTDRA
jgi:hypothetical protein